MELALLVGLWFLSYMFSYAGLIIILAIPMYFLSKRFF